MKIFEVFKNKKISKQSIILVPLVLLLAVSLVSPSMAWLFQNRDREHQLLASNFVFSCDVYFLQSNNTRVLGSAYRNATTGYYQVDVTNPNADNYATKLRVDVKYRGITKSYVRVYIGDMWLVNSKAILKMNTNFKVSSSNWLDNRIYDTYYYYVAGSTEEKGMVYSSAFDEVKTLTFIEGINDFARINNGSLYLNIRADAVQINRINAFWGIHQLPQ